VHFAVIAKLPSFSFACYITPYHSSHSDYATDQLADQETSAGGEKRLARIWATGFGVVKRSW
jgi:hypothetical protein